MNSGLIHLELDEWHDFASQHSDSSVFHHRNWIELLIEQYGFGLRIFGIKQGGEITAALPFCETRWSWGPPTLVCLPFTDWMKVLAQNETTRLHLIDGLRIEPFDDHKSVVLRTDKSYSGVKAVTHWLRHELSTDRPLEHLVANYPSSLRRNLTKAARCGLLVERRHDAAALAAFYRLHLTTRRKHGVPIQPKKFFWRLWKSILNQRLGFIAVVSQQGDPIAAGVFLTYQDTIIYKYGASNPQALDLRPNELMFQEVIRHATNEGFGRLDFGISGDGEEGLCRFKRKWGAHESRVFRLFFAGSETRPLTTSRSFRLASTVIRHSPLFVCRGLGEIFYRFRQ